MTRSMGRSIAKCAWVSGRGAYSEVLLDAFFLEHVEAVEGSPHFPLDE